MGMAFPAAVAAPAVSITPLEDRPLLPLETREVGISVTNTGNSVLETVYLQVEAEYPLFIVSGLSPTSRQMLAVRSILPGETKQQIISLRARAFSPISPKVRVNYGEEQELLTSQLTRSFDLEENRVDFQARLSRAVSNPGEVIEVILDLRNTSEEELRTIEMNAVLNAGDGKGIPLHFDVLPAGAQFLGNRISLTLPPDSDRDQGITTYVSFTRNGEQRTLERTLVVGVQNREGYFFLVGALIAVLAVAGTLIFFTTRRQKRKKGAKKEAAPAGQHTTVERLK